MRRLAITAAAIAIWSLVHICHAQIRGAKQLHIDLTDATDAAAKATWSDPDHIDITQDGLGRDGDESTSRDGWIRTKPIGTGYYWRPASNAYVHVNIQPSPKEFGIPNPNGQRSTPDNGNMFVRYSPDREHWSSWQSLQRAESRLAGQPGDPGRAYAVMLQVPRLEQDPYNALVREYGRRDVPWASDEEAAVRWILQSDPEFFTKRLPFIGYIELLWEGGFYGGQRIKSIDVDVSFVLPGRAAIPKDGNQARMNDSESWRFRSDDPAAQ